MKLSGQILKMITQDGKPIQYYLNLSGDLVHMNELINKNLTIEKIGFQCVECGKNLPIYRMGFCKNCFFESPYASDTIIRPELSTAHLGIEERNMEVEREIQLQPHTVYLAYTGEVKVGVTRNTQIPTRWIDQGATFALPIAQTENRYEAGMIEVALKNHIPDKTNWRKMLQNDFENDIDLIDFQKKIKQYIPSDFLNFYADDKEVWKFDYPYEKPEKINSVSLEKTSKISGKLIGIKGQYLSFEGGNFMNIRAHEGVVVELNIE